MLPNLSSLSSQILEWCPAVLGLGVDATTASAPYPSLGKMLSLGVLWPGEVDRICADARSVQYLVDGFLPRNTLAIAAGESTIGKSSLVFQLGLCIATGQPFLGMPVQQGRVLHFDLENSIQDGKTMRDAILTLLGVPEPPSDFLVMPTRTENLKELLGEIRPDLVSIDSLRSFNHEVTAKNKDAAEWLNELRSLSRKFDCSFLIVHHLRKPNREHPPAKIEDCNVTTWLEEMEGPRAFMNQTDVRIALAGRKGEHQMDMRWNQRVHGDSPVVPVERVETEDESPLGYRRLSGVRFLTREKQELFNALPVEFCTRDVKAARKVHGFGAGNDPTNGFLSECKGHGLVEKLGHGRWRKLVPSENQ